MGAMRVPTYGRYLKDILNNKRLLLTTGMVKLTEECSNVILHWLLEKKKDPGCTTISCSIGTQHLDQALCDLGASASVVPKDIFEKLNYTVDFVVLDMDSDKETSLILGRRFLTTAKASIDVGVSSIRFHNALWSRSVMKRWLSCLFKGSGSESSRHQDESSDRSSADVSMEDTDAVPQL
uniref:Uncharacterized protein n=1 Tax=Oryza sativa subsp. japonica TaxID=39947 RepID=Q69MK3_ORYSJ|nr:hypothetical protein [Oryza sativa Japonica Group]